MTQLKCVRIAKCGVRSCWAPQWLRTRAAVWDEAVPWLNTESKYQRRFEAISCHRQKINFSASCISLGSRALEITAKFDAPKMRPGRVKFG